MHIQNHIHDILTSALRPRQKRGSFTVAEPNPTSAKNLVTRIEGKGPQNQKIEGFD